MRLRLNIKRHELPQVNIMHGIPTASSTTISELVSQVNNVIPLESGEGHWGLEDYITSVGGFECVHYTLVRDVLKEDDEVEIRHAQTVDVRARRLSGRMQISREGARLLDGIPYGSRRMRRITRPPIQIPPLKKKRLLDADENDEDDDASFTDAIMENGLTAAGDSSEATSDSIMDSSQDGDTQDGGHMNGADHTSLRASTSSARKRKRVQFEGPYVNLNEDEGNDSDWGGSNASIRDIISISSRNSSSDRSSAGPDHALEGGGSSAEEDVEGLSSGASSTNSDSSGLPSDSTSGSDSITTDDSSAITSPSSSGTTNKHQGSRLQKSAKAINSAKMALQNRSVDLKKQVKGLLHPTLATDDYLKQLSTANLANHTCTILTAAPPGEGKLRTQQRNRRRKKHKIRKILAGKEREDNAENNAVLPSAEPDESPPDTSRQSTGSMNEDGGDAQASNVDRQHASEQIDSNTGWQHAAHDALASKTVEKIVRKDDDQHTTHDTLTSKSVGSIVRNADDQDVARKVPARKRKYFHNAPRNHSPTPSEYEAIQVALETYPDESLENSEEEEEDVDKVYSLPPSPRPSGPLRPVAELCAADKSLWIEAPAGDNEVSETTDAGAESSIPAEVDAITSEAAPTATTGPRLRVGAAAKRTITSALGSSISKKGSADTDNAPEPQPPAKQNPQDALKLQAVECGASTIDLIDPPFPFEQRWHNVPGPMFGVQKGDYMHSVRNQHPKSSEGEERGLQKQDGHVGVTPKGVEKIVYKRPGMCVSRTGRWSPRSGFWRNGDPVDPKPVNPKPVQDEDTIMQNP